MTEEEKLKFLEDVMGEYEKKLLAQELDRRVLESQVMVDSQGSKDILVKQGNAKKNVDVLSLYIRKLRDMIEEQKSLTKKGGK